MSGAARELERPGVSRRTVVVGIAWATPVVMGLSAAPAFASSSPPDDGKAVLTLSTATASLVRSSGAPTGLALVVSVANTLRTPDTPVSSLVVAVKLPAAYFSPDAEAQLTVETETVPPGLGVWPDSLSSPSVSDDFITYSLVFTGTLSSTPASDTGEVSLWIPSDSIPSSAVPISVEVLVVSSEASNAPSASLLAR